MTILHPTQVRVLFEMNLSHVLGVIFQYCRGAELCAIAQVGSMDESVAWCTIVILKCSLRR